MGRKAEGRHSKKKGGGRCVGGKKGRGQEGEMDDTVRVRSIGIKVSSPQDICRSQTSLVTQKVYHTSYRPRRQKSRWEEEQDAERGIDGL